MQALAASRVVFARPWLALFIASAVARAAAAQCEFQALASSSPASFGQFGVSVALDGDRALVGTTEIVSGSVHVFTRSNDTWFESQPVLSSGSTVAGFGASCAISGEWAAIGAPELGSSGTVELLRSVAGVWVPVVTLTQPLLLPGTGFGRAVDLDGDVLVVGTANMTIPNQPASSFSIYERSGSSWSQVAMWSAFDPTGTSVLAFDVAVDGELAAAGNPGGNNHLGEVVVYARNAGAWTPQQVLTAADGTTGDSFGYAVAIAGERVFVGAPFDDGYRGSVYVYHRVGGTFVLEQKLLPLIPYPYQEFGVALDAEGARVVVGAPHTPTGGPDVFGTAQYFAFDGAGWTHEGISQPAAAGTLAWFGTSVALSGAVALVGAPGDTAISALDGSAFFMRVPHSAELVAAVDSISVSAGGTQPLTTRTCAPAAGDLYFVLGSLSGTTPGISAAGVELALNPDAYFSFTLANPNGPILQASLGVLDATGSASSAVVLPAGTAGTLAGLVAHHAVVVIDPIGGTIESVSAPRALALLP